MENKPNNHSNGMPINGWRQAVAKYQKPDALRSWWQLINSVVPYFILWYLMIESLNISYWLTLLLAIPAAGFLVRIFIIFHDCGHGSFFKSRRLNDAVGIFTGLFTFTPYYQWRYSHAVHHATVGDLDRRGTGDVWTLTVYEYQALSPWRKLIYRVFRNPLVMFTVGALGVFLIGNRIPRRDGSRRVRASAHWTNLAVVGIIALLSFTIGIKTYVLVQLPVLLLSASAGVWLFYVQHQYEGVYWERHDRWDFVAASLKGSSYYKLPKVLQWFSGNIGFHHIHHISPKIPNYLLEKCYRENPLFQQVKPLTLLGSFKSMFLHLWDEESKQLVSFAALKKLQDSANPS
jgi:omega-6 fatty acid desaturase (delta-12 desaturase)